MAITAENSSVDDLEGKETANTMMSRMMLNRLIPMAKMTETQGNIGPLAR